MADGLAQLAEMPQWLADLDDDALVQGAIAAVVPGVRRAKLSGVRLKPGSWTARCTLDIADRVIPLSARIFPPGQRHEDEPAPPPQHVHGTASWHFWLPELGLDLVSRAEPEEDLPAVAMLTDAERAGPLLEAAIRQGAPAYREMRILGVTPHVMRHSPGSRCTVLYRLELPPEDAGRFPDTVVAKTYHRADKGRIAWDGMRALWNSPLAGSAVVSIAEPLAWLPEPRILVQGPIAGKRTLKDLLLRASEAGSPTESDDLCGSLAATADGLAALHQCGAISGEPLTWEDELAEVRGVLARLVAVVPTLEGAADNFLSDLETRAAHTAADLAGPAHRSFRPAQVLLHNGDIGFIDFDGFCQAEPALDVALFRATTRDLGMAAMPAEVPLEARLAALDDLCEKFLGSYEAIAPISRERVALWEALDLLTNVLHSWTKAKPARLERSMALLRHHAESLRVPQP